MTQTKRPPANPARFRGLDPKELEAALHHARTVLSLGQDDGNALAFTGVVLANGAHDFPAALGAVEKAVALNPNSARAHSNRGWVQMMMERNDEAVKSCERAIRLSPFDPLNYGPQSALSILHYRAGRFEDALNAAQKTVDISAHFALGHVMSAASYIRLGSKTEAQRAVRRLLGIHPRYSLKSVASVRYGGSAH